MRNLLSLIITFLLLGGCKYKKDTIKPSTVVSTTSSVGPDAPPEDDGYIENSGGPDPIPDYDPTLGDK